MKRSEFGKKIKSHDWYYGYSDDHRVWTRGKDAARVLRVTHEELDCPFDMGLLEKWAHNMVLEEFAEEAVGEWYRQPRKYKCVAPTKREGLITQARYDEISQWMTLGATVEDVASVA